MISLTDRFNALSETLKTEDLVALKKADSKYNRGHNKLVRRMQEEKYTEAYIQTAVINYMRPYEFVLNYYENKLAGNKR